MEDPPDLEALARAHATIGAIRAAIVAGDEATITRLVYPPTAFRMGARPGTIGRTIVDVWGKPLDWWRSLRTTLTARLLPGGLVAFGMVETSPEDALRDVGLVVGPTPAVAFALIEDGAGGWQFWGSPDVDEWRAAIRVELPPPTVGLMQ